MTQNTNGDELDALQDEETYTIISRDPDSWIRHGLRYDKETDTGEIYKIDSNELPDHCYVEWAGGVEICWDETEPGVTEIVTLEELRDAAAWWGEQSILYPDQALYTVLITNYGLTDPELIKHIADDDITHRDAVNLISMYREYRVTSAIDAIAFLMDWDDEDIVDAVVDAVNRSKEEE